MMKLSEFAERFIFIRRCAGCGSLMGYEGHRDAFCVSCRIKWEMAKAESCEACQRAMIECECMPKKLSKSGMLVLKKLIAYETAKTSKPENKMLYFLKHHKNTRIAAFVAEQLSRKITELQLEIGGELCNFVITYIPKTKRARAEYGFDQSELVCREINKLLGIEVVSIFKRVKHNREQKKLNSLQRMQNVSKSIELCEEKLGYISDKHIILFDDIVSSGASMARATELLHKFGVKNIFGLCIAYTPKSRT